MDIIMLITKRCMRRRSAFVHMYGLLCYLNNCLFNICSLTRVDMVILAISQSLQ